MSFNRLSGGRVVARSRIQRTTYPPSRRHPSCNSLLEYRGLHHDTQTSIEKTRNIGIIAHIDAVYHPLRVAVRQVFICY